MQTLVNTCESVLPHNCQAA